MSVQVFSEIAPLKKVLVHAPGPEVDTMLPEQMHRFLFDDVLYGVQARAEHRQFRSILRAFGVEVVDSQQLLREALEAAPDAAQELVADVQASEGLGPEVAALLGSLDPFGLADALVQGLPPKGAGVDELFRDAPLPLPNLLFSRDAGVVVGDRLVVASMRTAARQREPLLLRFAFRHHPDLRGTPVLVDFTPHGPRNTTPTLAAPTLEGGDVLVMHEGVVLVGISERTMQAAADRLVEALRGDERFHTAILVFLPAARHAMHLDTVFTRASHDECLVYAPMIEAGNLATASAVRIDLRSPDDYGRRYPSLLHALAASGVELTPMACGGRASLVQQAREQWTDGANCFTLQPGVVVLYGRNRHTAEELYHHGYEIVEVGGLPYDEDGRCLRSFAPHRKYALLLEGGELSRARGGPRCMTMPLVREALRA